MTDQQQKGFIQIVTSLFHAQEFMVDLFFKKRLSEEIESVINKHIQYSIKHSPEFLVVYIQSLKDLSKVLEEIRYLKNGDEIQLALAHEQVLRYQADLISGVNSQKNNSQEFQEPIKSKPVTDSIKLNPQPNLIAKEQVIKKSIPIKGKLTKTQENILEFVRQAPDCRTKDVVNQFSDLSERTVKRSLKELSEGGKISKRFDSGAVYYSIL